MSLMTVSDADILTKVKNSLGVTGNYQDNTLNIYISDVKEYMRASGIDSDVVNSTLSIGAICRGVADLWNYGQGNTNFSPYFLQRVTQLAYESEGD